MRLVLDNMDGVLKHLDASEIEEAHGRRDALLRDLGDRIAHAFGGSKPHSVTLSPGCELCGQGSWSCLFLNGVCNASCFFCPGDMVHRDAPPNAERISFYSTGDYLAYVDKLGFRGVSFSGGEPFLTFDRFLEYTTTLRRARGNDLYLWAYTNGKATTKEKLQAVAAAGLDELRFNICACDYELDSVAEAVGVIPRVTVEIPAIPDEAERLRSVLPRLQKVGVDHLNLHQLMLMGSNGPALAERSYTFLRYPTPAVLESELSALETMRFALEIGLKTGINYCSLAFKYRWQNRGEDLRGGALALQPYETQCETGYTRRLWIDTEPELAQRLRAGGTPTRLWEYREEDRTLLFHPSLAAEVTTDTETVRVVYLKAVTGERESEAAREIADYHEVELTPTKTIGVRLIPMCAPIDLTVDQAIHLENDPPDAVAYFERVAPGLPDYA